MKCPTNSSITHKDMHSINEQSQKVSSTNFNLTLNFFSMNSFVLCSLLFCLLFPHSLTLQFDPHFLLIDAPSLCDNLPFLSLQGKSSFNSFSSILTTIQFVSPFFIGDCSLLGEFFCGKFCCLSSCFAPCCFLSSCHYLSLSL